MEWRAILVAPEEALKITAILYEEKNNITFYYGLTDHIRLVLTSRITS